MACAADPAVSLLLAKSVAVTDSRAPDRGVLEAAPRWDEPVGRGHL